MNPEVRRRRSISADLATIGSVADVAPVLGENRSIARIGLQRLRSKPRAGLAALLRRAGIDPAVADLETVSFVIAPRINAAGRVGEAMDAARLLLTDDPTEADALAERLDVANVERRALTKDTVDEAEAAVLAAIEVDAGPAILVHGPWPIGIVGLVASRLAERNGRPAVVGADLGDVIRASCRSAAGFDLGAALEQCAELLVRHGGHRAAAGFEDRRRSLARSSSTRFQALRPRPRFRRSRAPSCSWTQRCLPSRSTMRWSAISPAWPRPAPGTPNRSWPFSASP